MTYRYLIGIFGGVGSGKKLLAENLSRHLRDPRIQIFSDTLSKSKPLDFRVYIDRPFDQILENYVLSLSPKLLTNHEKLKKNLEEFRKFHLEKVVPQKALADYWYSGEVEDDEKIHQLALSILKKKRNFDEDENVKIYLEANHRPLQEPHPEKLKMGNSEVF
ncbi:unnamed protein product [Caenorhabditis brenneri]